LFHQLDLSEEIIEQNAPQGTQISKFSIASTHLSPLPISHPLWHSSISHMHLAACDPMVLRLLQVYDFQQFSFSGNYSFFAMASPLLHQALFNASKEVGVKICTLKCYNVLHL